MEEPAPGLPQTRHGARYSYGKWRDDGTWQRANEALRQQQRARKGLRLKPCVIVIASQSEKTTEAGEVRGHDAGKKVKGRKLHIAVDTLRNLLELVVHAASIQDRNGARLLPEGLGEAAKSSAKLIWTDGACKGRLVAGSGKSWSPFWR